MKVWKDSGTVNFIKYLDELSEIRSVQIIIHFQLFYSDKNCSLLSLCYSVSSLSFEERFSSGTFSKSPEIVIFIVSFSRHSSFRIVGRPIQQSLTAFCHISSIVGLQMFDYSTVCPRISNTA